MSLTLDDLGRAVFESTPEELRPVKKTWEELDDESHRVANIFALAAVELFAEELVDDILYFDESHPKEKIRQLLASLRDEAQKGNEGNGIPNHR